MKRLLALLTALLLCLPLCAFAGEKCVIDLISDPEAEYAFREGAELLEVVFPALEGCDGFILRCGGASMLVDCGTNVQAANVAAMLDAMGIDTVQHAFNSHPHNDHITGFAFLPEHITLERFYITFPDDWNSTMRSAMQHIRQKNIPWETVEDGYVFTLGGATATVIQRPKKSFATNDRSAMLMVRYGQRSLLLSADVELGAQNELLRNPPEGGLKADILKYPHHGVAKAGWNFFAQIAPEVCIATSKLKQIPDTVKDCKKKGVPLYSTAHTPLLLRTDGEIWVLEEMPLPQSGE